MAETTGKQNHEDTLRRLMEAYEVPIRRMCYMYLKDQHPASDAVQETFLKAYFALDRFRGYSSEKTWLMRIALNVCHTMGETEEAQLQFSLPARPDPIPSHRHEWMEARCVNPKTCSICGRTEGELGKHDFAPATCISPKKCTVCGTTWGTLSLRHPYNENGVCPICGKVKRQSSPAP